MDDSVIVINDSITTIESDADADVEDGEVTEADTEHVNIAAKSRQSPPPPVPTRETNNEDGKVIFEVHFRDRDDYESLHKRLLKMLNTTFAEDEIVFKLSDSTPSIIAHEKSEIVSLPDDDLFLIDTAPAVRLNAAQVPSYKRSHGDILDEETSARKRQKLEAVNKCFRPKVQSSCFNCGDTDHSLRECTRPRNQARIQRARKRSNFRADRYHVDTEQRFAHIRPGKISSKTRHAMGFSRGELPFMFYRMRLMGYPPAWLEEAKVQSSGIALFNADGSEVQGPEQEEGEEDSFKYDINKIIDFPGFNVEPGSKFYDDYQHHNVPRFQEQQLKANFIQSLGENVTKGYKRKKLIELPTPHDANPMTIERGSNLVEHDMDVDDGEDEAAMQPPLPTECIQAAPPPPPPTEGTAKRAPSPTLEDLRAQQAQLLQQLESNTSLNASEVGTVEVTANDESTIETAPAPAPAPSSAPSSAPASSSVAVPEVSKATIFNGPSIEGTPVLKFSIYDKLPVGDNFKVGVSDVINFENLPDSTGKYEQMKGVLKNVRQRMEKLQNDDN
ncbi:zinc finger CCHC domain-containing protein 8 homolog isoform X2 [Drosophila grimshawi]|uniref:zinc finger CCHC domain-containing protein 8 homolog isoform X2 n=1 Tax=Drosophila grimshawi TaxID=7222 RepID=UPI0013EEF6ED|nr:zinc finger CCHC domain-containing protein 8 homolog isoform X2 [Drosophila grimshawi]